MAARNLATIYHLGVGLRVATRVVVEGWFMRVGSRVLLRRIRSSTWLLIALQILALAGLAKVYYLTFPVQSNSGHDFRLLYGAAQLMRAHQNPYDAATFQHQVVADGMPIGYLMFHGELGQPYVYPPLFAWLVIPFTYLSILRALFAWRVLSCLCVFAGALGLTSLWDSAPGARFFDGRANRVLLATLAASSPLALYAAYWGNPVVLVYCAMGLWAWALKRNNARADSLAGVLMSVALLKPQLAFPLTVFAVFCLIQGQGAWARRLRVALSFGAALVVLLALDILITGPSLLLAWPASGSTLSQLIYLQTDMPTLAGLLPPTPVQHSVRVQTLSLYGIAVLGLIVALVLYLRVHRTCVPGALLAVLTAIWGFAGPSSHPNDEGFYLPLWIAIVAVLAAMCERDVAGLTFRKLGRRIHEYARLAIQAAVSALALVVLWLGGALQLRYGTVVLHVALLPGHLLQLRWSATIVPLAVLVAFFADWNFHRRRTQEAAAVDKQLLSTGHETLLTPSLGS